jgi:hypothetical protein
VHALSTRQQQEDEDHDEHQDDEVQLGVVALLGHLKHHVRLVANTILVTEWVWRQTYPSSTRALGLEAVGHAGDVVVDLVQQSDVQLRFVLDSEAVVAQVRYALADQVQLLVLVLHDLVLHAQQLHRRVGRPRTGRQHQRQQLETAQQPTPSRPVNISPHSRPRRLPTVIHIQVLLLQTTQQSPRQPQRLLSRRGLEGSSTYLIPR